MLRTCGWDLTERASLAKLFECREGKLDSKIGRFVDFLSIAAWYSRSHVPVDVRIRGVHLADDSSGSLS